MLPHPSAAVIFKVLPDGAVLLDTSTEVYYGLNEVGAHVWELLPPVARDFDDLCARLAAIYPDAPIDTIRGDVSELLEQLHADGLVSHIVHAGAPGALAHAGPSAALAQAR